jgi:hypothetical protein
MPIFDNASLASAVSEALATAAIPADKENAFAVVVTKAGVKGVISVRVNDVWQVDSVFAVNHKGHIDGGLAIKGSW